MVAAFRGPPAAVLARHVTVGTPTCAQEKRWSPRLSRRPPQRHRLGVSGSASRSLRSKRTLNSCFVSLAFLANRARQQRRAQKPSEAGNRWNDSAISRAQRLAICESVELRHRCAVLHALPAGRGVGGEPWPWRPSALRRYTTRRTAPSRVAAPACGRARVKSQAPSSGVARYMTRSSPLRSSKVSPGAVVWQTHYYWGTTCLRRPTTSRATRYRACSTIARWAYGPVRG